MRGLHRPLTLRSRLIAALLALSAIGLALFAGTSVLLLRPRLLHQVDERLRHQVHRIYFGVDRQRIPSDYLIIIFSPEGPERIGQQPGQPGGPTLTPATVQEHGGPAVGNPVGPSIGVPFTVPDQTDGSAWRVLVVTLPGRPTAALALSLNSPVDAVLRSLLIIEGIVGGAVLALIGVIATVVVRLGLRPLTRIERTAE
ncbi:MAG: hypothetical protein ACRDSH_20335, partial [Pseudonocardiaceae bacterium]